MQTGPRSGCPLRSHREVGERWPLGQEQEEASTHLVSGPESVLLAQDQVCCLLGALSGKKKKRRSREGDFIRVSASCPLIAQVCTQAQGQPVTADIWSSRNGPTGDSGVRKAWVQAPVLSS